MVDLLNLTVPGDPIPKGRARVGAGRVYTPARTALEEERVRQLAAVAYRRAPYGGPVGIEAVFFCASRRLCDGDNLLKLVTDAIQRGRRGYGGVILNDSQILDWHGRVHRAKAEETPRTELRVWTLEE